jgi:hypothetical protein
MQPIETMFCCCQDPVVCTPQRRVLNGLTSQHQAIVMLHGAAPRFRRAAPAAAPAAASAPAAACRHTSITDLPVDILRDIVTQSAMNHRRVALDFVLLISELDIPLRLHSSDKCTQTRDSNRRLLSRSSCRHQIIVGLADLAASTGVCRHSFSRSSALNAVSADGSVLAVVYHAICRARSIRIILRLLSRHF